MPSQTRDLVRSNNGSPDGPVGRSTTRCVAHLYARTKSLPTFGASQRCEHRTYLRYLLPNVSVIVIAIYWGFSSKSTECVTHDPIYLFDISTAAEVLRDPQKFRQSQGNFNFFVLLGGGYIYISRIFVTAWRFDKRLRVTRDIDQYSTSTDGGRDA
jgi:hypothetical protein